MSGEGRHESTIFAAGTPAAPLLLIDAPTRLVPRPDLLAALKAALKRLAS